MKKDDGIEYTMHAIETKYKGVIFRSRLEAKWAAMFDLLGWKWDYEPIDFNGWIPDFAIYGDNTVYVEVKPIDKFPDRVSERIDASGCKDEVLIVGMKCPIRSGSYDIILGWLRESLENQFTNAIEFWWEEASFGRWALGSKKSIIGFCHTEGRFVDRITGGYDGGSFGSNKVTVDEITKLWREAGNLTRWEHK